ncbi:Nn.00g043450.m01.CDS01 [Neocucurbitaria sp. VM-36]
MNLTQAVKTAGGRTEAAINNIYHIDQSSRIGIIVVVQHTTCPWSLGDIEANLRSDIQSLKTSPYVRNEIPIIGYLLDVATRQLREVKYVRSPPQPQPTSPTAVFQNPVMPLLWHSASTPSPK